MKLHFLECLLDEHTRSLISSLERSGSPKTFPNPGKKYQRETDGKFMFHQHNADGLVARVVFEFVLFIGFPLVWGVVYQSM